MTGLRRAAPLLLVALLFGACADASSGPAIPQVAPAPEIGLPPGFAAYVVADGLDLPAVIAPGPDGDLFVAQTSNTIIRLTDTDGDGVFETMAEITHEIHLPNGLAFSPSGELYVSWEGHVSILRDPGGDGAYEVRDDIITGLPHGRHQNNGIEFGPDGKLYITNGSGCNDCEQPDPRAASILRADPDGSGLEVYAKGLRNSYDIEFDPSGRLWATDNGSDPPCNTIDEVDLIEQGGDYGWPYGPGCDSLESGIPPVADLGYNTAATAIVYYDADQFPDAYRGTFFIALFGNYAFAPYPAGRTLVSVRVVESEGERPRGEVTEFGMGFTRPVYVALDRDGTLLVADFELGRIYRIVYVED